MGQLFSYEKLTVAKHIARARRNARWNACKEGCATPQIQGRSCVWPFIALAALLVGSHVTGAQERTVIRVAGPPNEGYKDVYYGVKSGLFAKYGLDVQPRIANGGAIVLAGLAGGAYDVAYSNLVPIIQAYVHGLPFQIIAPSTLFIGAHQQNAMLVTRDSPLRTAHDLDGKTIGTQSLQDLNSVAMRAWIDKNGGDASTIHILEVPSASTVAALTSHRVEAMALSEPLLTESLDTGKVRVFAKPQTAIAERFQAQAFVANSDYVAQHPDVMARFARAMHESALYNNAHIAETAALVASFSDVPADIISRTVRSIDAEYAAPGNIQPVIDFAREVRHDSAQVVPGRGDHQPGGTQTSPVMADRPLVTVSEAPPALVIVSEAMRKHRVVERPPKRDYGGRSTTALRAFAHDDKPYVPVFSFAPVR